MTRAKKHDRLPVLDPLFLDKRFASLHVRVYDYLQLWSPALTRSRARDVLGVLLQRLYTAGSGQIVDAETALSRVTLAQEMGVSQHWLGVLLSRLCKAGWIVFEGASGAATRFRAGPQLVRVECLLTEGADVDAPT